MALFTQEAEKGSSKEVTFAFDFTDFISDSVLWTKKNEKGGTDSMTSLEFMSITLLFST